MLAIRTTVAGQHDLVRVTTDLAVEEPLAIVLGAFTEEVVLVSATATPNTDSIAFNAAGTKGLLNAPGGNWWARSPSAGTWVEGSTLDLFAVNDSDNMYSCAFGSGDNCVMVGVRSGTTLQKFVVLHSTNAGVAWTETASDISAINANQNPRVGYGGGVFLAIVNIGGSVSQSAMSSDQGATWTVGGTFASGVIGRPVLSGSRWVVTCELGFAYSDNDGTSWTYVSAPGTGDVLPFSIASLDGDLIAVGMSDASVTGIPALWRSANNGTSWAIEENLPGLGAVGVAIPCSIVAVQGVLVCGVFNFAGGDTIAWSGDGGLTWTELSHGLGDSDEAMWVADAAGRLVFGHGTRVFTSDAYVVTGGESGTVGAAGNYLTDDGLLTAVTVSLFTDARATAEDGLRPGVDPRGCWTDTLEDGPRPKGSKLWLLKGAKTIDETLRKAERWSKEALAWMLQAKLASAVEVVATRDGDEILLLTVSITRPGESSPWEHTWRLHLAL